MNVLDLMKDLSEYPGDMEVRGLWEGITTAIKGIEQKTLKLDGEERSVVLLDVDNE